MPDKTAYASHLATNVPSVRQYHRSSGCQWCSLCPRMPSVSAAMLQGLGPRFLPTTGSRVLALTHEQKKTNQAAFHSAQTKFHSSLLQFHCRECMCIVLSFWHRCGLMKCQGETVSLLVGMCNHIGLYENVNTHPSTLVRRSSSSLSEQLRSNMLDS